MNKTPIEAYKEKVKEKAFNKCAAQVARLGASERALAPVFESARDVAIETAFEAIDGLVSQIREEVEGMNKMGEEFEHCDGCSKHAVEYGYDKAIRDVLSVLNNKHE